MTNGSTMMVIQNSWMAVSADSSSSVAMVETKVIMIAMMFVQIWNCMDLRTVSFTQRLHYCLDLVSVVHVIQNSSL